MQLSASSSGRPPSRWRAFFILWLRRRRPEHLIRGLFRDYFAEFFAAEELGRRMRASVGRRFATKTSSSPRPSGAFQLAVNARLPRRTLLEMRPSSPKQFAALKTEFGLTGRYRIEGWRAGQGLLDSTTLFRWTKEDPARVCQRIRWTIGVAHRPQSGRNGNPTGPIDDQRPFETDRPFQSCQSVAIAQPTLREPVILADVPPGAQADEASCLAIRQEV